MLHITGWQWVLRCLSGGELESLVTVMLSHLQLLPPLYLPHALLLDASAQLVFAGLLAGLEHIKIDPVSFNFEKKKLEKMFEHF